MFYYFPIDPIILFSQLFEMKNSRYSVMEFGFNSKLGDLIPNRKYK